MENLGLGNSIERELNYYRRECNDLGARLLRLQEEQSQAFREARRSRTVVKLLREAYRLGDMAAVAADVGGPMLEIVVDTAVCDRAAFLREEPVGSGRFLIAHMIGLSGEAAQATVNLSSPPDFACTSMQDDDRLAAADLTQILQLPFILWAYDQSSGHALVLGNRSETNVKRPFEVGDREFIEAALSVYLDVLYRKHAEAQLRQAKQAAEAASASRAALLDTLVHELRMPLQAVIALFELIQKGTESEADWQEMKARTGEIADACSYLLTLAEDAVRIVDDARQALTLDIGWTSVDDIVRPASRAAYPATLQRGVELVASPPERRTEICVDRTQMQQAIQTLATIVASHTPQRGAVSIGSSRRSDGCLEILVRSAWPFGSPAPESSVIGAASQWAVEARLSSARRIVEAHNGVVTIEKTLGGAQQARVILPELITRDADRHR